MPLTPELRRARRKGLSPLIATVLIIGFTVALAVVIITWGAGLTKNIQGNVEQSALKQIHCSSDVALDIKYAKVLGNKSSILMDNKGIKITKLIFRFFGANGTDVVETDSGIDAYGIKSFQVAPNLEKTGKISEIEVLPAVIYNGEEVVCSNSFIKTANICWQQPKILIICNMHSSGSYYTCSSTGTDAPVVYELIKQGFDVTFNTAASTLSDLQGYDIIVSAGYVWDVRKGGLLKQAYDNGYKIITQGNDADSSIYPITTNEWRVVSPISWAMVGESNCGSICDGWTETVDIDDTGSLVTSIPPDAKVLARMKADSTKIALISLEKGRGRWVHIQPVLYANTGEIQIVENGARAKLVSNIVAWLSEDSC